MFKDVIELPSKNYYEVLFTVNGGEYVLMEFTQDGLCYSTELGDFTDPVYDVYDWWVADDYRVITITEEPTDAEFITWLKANTMDVQTNLNIHIADKNNPHEVTLAQLGVTATAEKLNYVGGVTSDVQTQLNAKASSSHNQSASTITTGTFAGQVFAHSTSQSPSTSLLRNSKLVSSNTNPGVNGEIYWTYG